MTKEMYISKFKICQELKMCMLGTRE